MIRLSLKEVASHLNYTLPNQDIVFEGISTDSRTIKPTALFVAIRGEHFDGHDFVESAFQKGANAAVVDCLIDCPIPQLIVKDTTLALGQITQFWRNQFSLPIIGVTGSNGKTTLKNMIAAIFKAACKQDNTQVLATEGNLNNNIGVPLMLSRLTDKHRYAVLEMGMNHFGEIAYLTQLVKPTVAIVNNAQAAHLEGVGDLDGVARAKGEIFQGLPVHGTAVLNRDDPRFEYWNKLVSNHRKTTFGLEHPADVTAKVFDDHIQINTPRGSITVTLGLLGKHNVMNALAATAGTLALEIDLKIIKAGLESVKPYPGRMRPYLLVNNIRIIDDTYNANPFSMRAAIDTVSQMKGTKILVLGDMGELGAETIPLHRSIGTYAREKGIEYLFTFGKLSANMSETFGPNAQHFEDRDQLVSTLKLLLQKNTTVLVKGSRSMKMELFIEKLVPEAHLDHAH